MRSGFWVSVLFPSIGRTFWCIPVGFMILASTSQHHDQSRISRFFKHKVFYFFNRTSFACYILNPLVVMLLLFSCEYPVHFDITNLIPYVNGLYCLTIIASVAFLVLVGLPMRKSIDIVMKNLISSPSPKKDENFNEENENAKNIRLTDVKTENNK